MQTGAVTNKQNGGSLELSSFIQISSTLKSFTAVGLSPFGTTRKPVMLIFLSWDSDLGQDTDVSSLPAHSEVTGPAAAPDLLSEGDPSFPPSAQSWEGLYLFSEATGSHVKST